MSCNSSLSFMSRFCVLTGSRCYFVVQELHFPPHHCHFGAIHHSREWVKGGSDIQCCKLVSFLVHISYVVIINDVAHFFPTTVNNPVMAIKRQGVSVKLFKKLEEYSTVKPRYVEHWYLKHHSYNEASCKSPSSFFMHITFNIFHPPISLNFRQGLMFMPL